MDYPLTNIHPGAKIHPTAIIEPFATIGDNVEIGEGCHIYGGAHVMYGARLGKNVTVMPGAVVSGPPQDLKFRGEDTLAIIGDNTVIRECATVHRGTASKGKTVVGSNCLIMAYSHVAHDCVVHDHVIMSNATQVAGEVEIDNFAVIGGGSLIHQFTHIGPYAMIQGGSRLNKDIPPYALIGHEPASFAGINIVGLKRRGFSAEAIESIQSTYQVLYNSGLNFSDALAKIEELVPQTPERDAIIAFVRASQRGIVRGPLSK